MLAMLIPYQSNTYIILIVLFLVSAISSFYMPAFFALPPRLVKKGGDLLRLNSALSITALLASLLGASIGGISLSFIQIRGVIIVDLISFVILAVCIFLIKIPQQAVDSDVSFSTRWKDFYTSVIDGVCEIYKHSNLRGLMTIFFGYSLADGFFYPYLVVWATQILRVDNTRYGLLQSALTAGAAFGSAFVVWLGKRVSLPRIIVVMLIALGIFVISLAFNTSYAIAFCFVLLFSTMRASIGLPTTTLVQEKAGDQLIGRVMGAYQSLGEIAYVLALAATAIVIRFVGIQVLFVVGGIIYFVSGFVGLIFLRNVPTIAKDNQEALQTDLSQSKT